MCTGEPNECPGLCSCSITPLPPCRPCRPCFDSTVRNAKFTSILGQYAALCMASLTKNYQSWVTFLSQMEIEESVRDCCVEVLAFVVFLSHWCLLFC